MGEDPVQNAGRGKVVYKWIGIGVTGALALVGLLQTLLSGLSNLDGLTRKPNLNCVAEAVNLTPSDPQTLSEFQLVRSFLSPTSQKDLTVRFVAELRRRGYSEIEVKELLSGTYPHATQDEQKRTAYAYGLVMQGLKDNLAKSIASDITPYSGLVLIQLENKGRADAEDIRIEINASADPRNVTLDCPGETPIATSDRQKLWVKLDRLSPGARLDAAIWLGTFDNPFPDVPTAIDTSCKGEALIHTSLRTLGPSPPQRH